MRTNNDGKKFEFPLLELLLLVGDPSELFDDKVEGRQRSTMLNCSSVGNRIV
jgi:hypothetical protein